MSLQMMVLLGIQASILGTVFCYGLAATWQDAVHLVRHRGLLVRSLLSMFVVMPIAAIVIVSALPLPRPTQIVLIALAISPIPPMLPKKEGKAGGEASYGLGLMITVGLLAIVLSPLAAELIGAYFNRSFDADAAAVAKPVLLMIALPLALGMLVHAWKPELAKRLVRPLLIGSTVLLVVCALAIIASVARAMLGLIGNGTLLAMFLFACVGLLSGHWLGGPVGDQRTVLALSTASRHPAIALAIAKSNFPDERFLAATVVLYLLVATITVLPYVQWRKRSKD